VRTVIAIAMLAFASTAYAEDTIVTPDQIAKCASKWFQIHDGIVYCIKGEAWESAGKPVANPPVIIRNGSPTCDPRDGDSTCKPVANPPIIDMRYGAPIATVCQTPDCGKAVPTFDQESMPVTGCHDNPPTFECPLPPSGRIEPNWRNYNPGH
jgi:hypothetical protein